MKKCQNCQTENLDNDSFCRQCGAKLEDKSKPKKRKPWILIGILAIALICAGVFFLWPNQTRAEYQEKIAMAERYLEDLDYSRAEELFLEAREIDPKQPEVYEQLYRIYTIQDEPEKAEDIRDQASEKLPESVWTDVEKKMDEIEANEKPVPEMKVVKEIGKLDFAPISLDKKSWLLSSNGKYSFLYPDGTVEEVGEPAEFYLIGSPDPNALCAYMKVDDSYTSYSGGVLTRDSPFGFGGPITATPYVLNDQMKIELDPITASMNFDPEILEITMPIVISREFGVKGDYYIYCPGSDEFYGPFDEDSEAAFYKKICNLSDGNYYGPRQQVFSPFWVKNENPKTEDNGLEDLYTLYSKDGSKKESGYSKAVITDPYSIGAFKGKRYYLLDENLSPLYDGYYDGGVVPIDGKAPVEMDGEWKLIDLEDEDPKPVEKNEDPKPVEEEKPSGDNLFADMSGHYVKQGGRWGSEMDVASDGTIQGHAFANYRGSVEEAVYTARFEVIEPAQAGTPARIRLTNIVLVTAAGTQEEIDGVLHQYSDLDGFYLEEGQEYLVYPAGTRYGDLPEQSRIQWLNNPAPDDPLPADCFVLDDVSSLTFLKS